MPQGSNSLGVTQQATCQPLATPIDKDLSSGQAQPTKTRSKQKDQPRHSVPSTNFSHQSKTESRNGQSRNETHPRNEIYNRLMAILVHIAWYSFKTQVRLAQDTGLSKAAISRIIRGFHRPSYPAALLITGALEKRLQRTIDPREIFSLDGTYPTPSVCALVGCRNCLPEAAYDENGVIRTEYKDLKAGQWSMSTPSSGQGKFEIPGNQPQIQPVQ